MRERYPLNLLRVVSLLFGFATFFSLSAEAGIVTDRFPLQMYAESQINTYNNIGDARRAGWADGGTDLIRVTSINNGWLRVSHPGSGGRTVNRWCKANELFADPGYSNRGVNVRGTQTVYRTSTSGTKFGSVSNNESVIVLAEKNNRAQILYRLDNGTGYKAGWVPLSAVQEQENTGASATAYIPQGNFDTLASNGDHQIRVQGWALDRDDVNKQLEVHVYVGGGTGSGAECYSIRANKYRPDVNRAFPGVGDYHGFDETITVKRTGNQPVHVYAINIGGGRDNPELGHKTVAIRPLSATAYIPQGNFDTLASNSDHQIRVQGWALDRDDVTKQLEVHVYVGGGTGSGAESYAIRANKYRPDVNQAFPGVGDYHGFDETITVKRTGNQPVYVYAINIGGGKDNPELGHKTVAIRPYNSNTQIRYPLNNIYVCGNDWMTKYSKRPSRPYHAGIDVHSSSGDKTVYSVAAGQVVASGWNSANGNFVVIRHVISGKEIYSFYCHMSKYSVSKGNNVECGTPIGILGNTGSASNGEHLHFTFVDKLMSSGGYWGYVTTSGNAVYYEGYTFYSPAFVIDNQRLP